LTELKTSWQPARAEGLRRLAEFQPQTGRLYAARRNYDHGAGCHANVSTLSPYIRHRLISESEVIAAVLQSHSLPAAEKFVQEVCWRTYWKGWLEHRPQVWDDYLENVAAQRTALHDDDAAAAEIAAAERGDTGIDCFDGWVRELIETGYLHNHARMWFASIWIFTLRLPWSLGADFFLRHLLDGDPASNTLSWRWVAGLHTRGKTYLARPDNIARYTDGRFHPDRGDLAASAASLTDEISFERVPLRGADVLARALPNRERVILLLTEEDLSPETWPLADVEVGGVALFRQEDTANPAILPSAFKAGAVSDAATRVAARWGKPVIAVHCADELTTFAANQHARAIVTTVVPVGHVRPEVDRLTPECLAANIPLLQIARRWDSLFWPHATAGFFKLKERIPATLAALDLLQTENES
jgi:deoxyribodipyrimidine photo-lyase